MEPVVRLFCEKCMAMKSHLVYTTRMGFDLVSVTKCLTCDHISHQATPPAPPIKRHGFKR
jgi:RNase P subunit RPR2